MLEAGYSKVKKRKKRQLLSKHGTHEARDCRGTVTKGESRVVEARDHYKRITHSLEPCCPIR